MIAMQILHNNSMLGGGGGLRHAHKINYKASVVIANSRPMDPRNLSTPQINYLKSPKRISITIPHALHEILMAQSTKQGRSLSNLAAFILEQHLHNTKKA
ncbi:MAG: CopG-like 1 or ribbon-helix-helix domain, 5 [Cyanobacteriota bacterium]